MTVKLGNWLGLRCMLELCPTSTKDNIEFCRICGKTLALYSGTMTTKEGEEFEIWTKV